MSALLTTQQAASFLDLTESQLKHDRNGGVLTRLDIPFVRIGRNIRYAKTDLIKWQQTRVRYVEPRAERIQKEVCQKYGITLEEMLGDRRGRRVVRPRQEAMYRVSKETHHSLPKIARLFRRADHTTVMHAIRQVEKRMIDDRTP